MMNLDEMGVTPEIAEECIEFFKSISGVALTRDQLADLLDDDEELIAELVEWGVEDTEARGRLASALSEHIVGRSWPIYGEGLDLDAFVAELRGAAATSGYKVEAIA